MACIEICSVRPPQRLVVLVVGGERYNQLQRMDDGGMLLRKWLSIIALNGLHPFSGNRIRVSCYPSPPSTAISQGRQGRPRPASRAWTCGVAEP
jgi:hypothetical protein